ncbi:hypothetical protein DevBK_11425 [Devosia sp. BK]|uniref:hypothetical protein n=1 Tax=Devosia sp. BK TaxID=2871706 RepID=UPI00293A0AD0|nr:hypothetical protein [Devosia sp. BK]MDV3251944.1 hypothetical protein [Devosia sp. BK]
MKTWPIALAVVAGAAIVASAVVLKPSPFRECVGIISEDIFRQDLTVTLDPRDVEAQAARICSGVSS